jgi:hypothetical protein
MKLICVFLLLGGFLKPHLGHAEVKKDSFALKFNNPLDALIDTVQSPAFLIPTGIVFLTFYENIGKRITRKSRESHPLWGHRGRAEMMSDRYRTLSTISMVASTLAYRNEGFGSMASHLIFDVSAGIVALQARGLIRDGTNRVRPNGDPQSFPSGHATAAGARVALSNYNIFNSNLTKRQKYILAGTNWGIAYLVAYSRIEAHSHYPEDVAAGIALGYLVTNVLKKTFTNTYRSEFKRFYITSEDGGLGLNFDYKF